jgi:hypothetical protein
MTEKAVKGEYRWPAWTSDVGLRRSIWRITRISSDTYGLPLLRERGVRAEFTSYVTKSTRPSAPADWYVYEGVMVADGQALMLVNPTPNPQPRPRDAFCAEHP